MADLPGGQGGEDRRLACCALAGPGRAVARQQLVLSYARGPVAIVPA